METQQRRTGRHRLVYTPREDPLLGTQLQLAAERIARVVREGVEAVSPYQPDPDAQRRAVAIDVTGAILREAFRMLAVATAQRVQEVVPGIGKGVVVRAREVLHAPLNPPSPVIDLTNGRSPEERAGG